MKDLRTVADRARSRARAALGVWRNCPICQRRRQLDGWPSEADAIELSGRSVEFFRARLELWTVHGLAENPKPREWRYLRAAVIAVAVWEREGQVDCVYAIQNTGSGRVKIGVSANPAARLAQLQTASADRLVLIATVPGGVELEREMHRQFDDARIGGEWFEPSESLKSWLERVQRRCNAENPTAFSSFENAENHAATLDSGA